MTKNIPSITESEWEVLRVLWENAPRTASEINASLPEQKKWNPKTVRTLLDRLTQKGVVGINKDQRVYTFYPLYTQEECQRAKTDSFVKRFYDGTLKSMLVQFIQDEDFTEEDIKELRDILDKKEDRK